MQSSLNLFYNVAFPKPFLGWGNLWLLLPCLHDIIMLARNAMRKKMCTWLQMKHWCYCKNCNLLPTESLTSRAYRVTKLPIYNTNSMKENIRHLLVKHACAHILLLVLLYHTHAGINKLMSNWYNINFITLCGNNNIIIVLSYLLRYYFCNTRKSYISTCYTNFVCGTANYIVDTKVTKFPYCSITIQVSYR